MRDYIDLIQLTLTSRRLSRSISRSLACDLKRVERCLSSLSRTSIVRASLVSVSRTCVLCALLLLSPRALLTPDTMIAQIVEPSVGFASCTLQTLCKP